MSGKWRMRMNRKKAGIVIGTVIAIAALGGTGFYFREEIKEMLPFFQDGSAEDRVFVEKVSRVMNQYAGPSNRYNGTVESQDTFEVSVDSNRKVSEIKVAVGDVVEENQTLLTYDTSELTMQIAQANLEVESINNDIANYTKQKETLEQEREKAAESEQFSYTTQIQNIENSIAQKQFDLESKQLEISKFQKQVSNSEVKSKVAGVVREINEKGMDANGNTAPFMTILKTGEYRVKGSIDEQNIWTLSEGQAVVIRSRVDETKTWNGAISLIDTEKPQESGGNGMYIGGGSEETMTATKYPFYIDLESADGLILGQHVYIELDNGQEQAKEGLWLYGSYIVQDGDQAYVWAAGDKNRLEKRYVELGEYDEAMDEYEIVSGLTGDDYVTWPMPGLYEGVVTVTDEAEVDYSAPLYNQEQTGTEMPMDDMYTEDLYLDEMGTEYMMDEMMGTETVIDVETSDTEVTE